MTALPERIARGPHVHAFEAGDGDPGRPRPVTTEDVALVLFRMAAGVTGSLVVSQISSGHKNQLRFEISTADATLAFDQEQPDTLWLGRRTASELLTRDAAQVDPSAAAYVTLPPGHPQGTRTASTRSWPTPTAPSRRARATSWTGCPLSPTAPVPCVTEAVLRSASTHRWEDVPGEPRTDGGAT